MNSGSHALATAIDAAAAAEPGTPGSDWTRQGALFFTYVHFVEALECSLHCGIDELLSSQWPLNRALAMLDRRLGKRRFLRLEQMEREHPLVQRLHGIRAEAEGWAAARPDA
jgi:hypothetical protein